MSLFAKPEVIILKESSDAKEYLSRLEELQATIKKGSSLYKKIDREISIVKAGIIGEDNILFELKNSGMDLVVLHDICLVDEKGNKAQIDFLVQTPYVKVIIECKNLFGDIEINSKGEFIRTIEYGGKKYKEGIYSPVTQNERHMLVFKNVSTENKNIVMRLGFEAVFDQFQKSLIVLANPKTVLNDKYAPKEVKSLVIRADQLISKLKSMKSPSKFSKKEMLEECNNILSCTVKNRKDYLEKFIELKNDAESEEKAINPEAVPEPKPTPNPSPETDQTAIEKKLCPRCGSEMILRTAKKGNYQGNQFWGCSRYPKCRYMENRIPDHD